MVAIKLVFLNIKDDVGQWQSLLQALDQPRFHGIEDLSVVVLAWETDITEQARVESQVRILENLHGFRQGVI
jgi:hypothetical protein